MMDAALANRLAGFVRAADPDRYFASLFAPQEERFYLFALYAFNAEVARIAETVREPMLGAIRLQWWRETLQTAAHGNPRNHDVAKGLAILFADKKLVLSDFEAILDARAFDFSLETFEAFQALENYIDATSAALMRLAASVLGKGQTPTRDAGLAFGLTGVLRALPFHNGRHKLYLPLDLLGSRSLTRNEFFHLPMEDAGLKELIAPIVQMASDHFEAARNAPPPGKALPAILPAALVPLYLRNLLLGRDMPIHRRQMVLLAASLRGKL